MSERIVGRVRLAVAQQFASLGLMVAFAVVSARWLGPSGKGELAIIVAAGVLCSAILGLGIPQALTIWVSNSRFSVREAMLAGYSWSALVAAAVAAVTSRWSSAGLGVSLLWLSVGVLLVDQVTSSVAVGAGDLRVPLIIKVLGGGAQVVFMTVGLILAIQPDMRRVAVLYYVLPLVVILLITRRFVVDSQSLPSRVGREWRAVLKDSLSIGQLGLRIMPAQILTMANSRVDILVLAWLATTSEVGVYSLAVSATLLVGVVPAALGQALTRTFGSEIRPVDQLRRGIQASLFFGLATAVGIAVLSPLAVPVIFGPEFSAASVLIAVMVPFTATFATVQVSYPFFYNQLHRPGAHSIVVGLTALVDIVLVILLVPRYGALGAAIASAAAYAVGSAINLAITARGAEITIRELIVPSREDAVWIYARSRELLSADSWR